MVWHYSTSIATFSPQNHYYTVITQDNIKKWRIFAIICFKNCLVVTVVHHHITLGGITYWFWLMLFYEKISLTRLSADPNTCINLHIADNRMFVIDWIQFYSNKRRNIFKQIVNGLLNEWEIFIVKETIVSSEEKKSMGRRWCKPLISHIVI